jgi:hypothetical protein
LTEGEQRTYYILIGYSLTSPTDRRAHFHSAYEIYAHVLVAELRGVSDDKIATIVAGQRPGDLTREEIIYTPYYTDLRKFLDATVFCIPDRGEVARSS